MLKEQVEEVIAEYYVSIGVEPDYFTRKSEQAQSRAAMMCALSDSMTASAISRIFKKHHATVLHHRKSHEANVACWDGYNDKYEIARSMVNVNLRSKTIQSQLDRIEKEIGRLNEISNKLKKSIQLTNNHE